MSTPYTPSTSNSTSIVTPGAGSGSSLSGSDISRVLPRQVSSGATRGTQNVGYGNTKIDGSNNSITVGDSIVLDGNNGTINVGDGGIITIGDTITISGASNNEVIEVKSGSGSSVGIGAIPGSNPIEFGFFSLNDQGNVTYKVVAGVQYFYDNNNNLIQKVQAGTTYVYNPADSFRNVTQSGLLPDGSGGFVAAKPGFNVSDIFS